jgi:hypothetical protein
MASDKKGKAGEEEEFQPKGALALVIIFLITLILLWGSVYFILLSRGVTI